MLTPRSVPLLFALGVAGVAGCTSRPDVDTTLAQRLPVYGHRNLILIADSAYPAQTSPGVEVVSVGGSHADVVKRVLAAVAASKHVRAKITTDAELAYVSEKYAPGVSALRAELRAATAGVPATEMRHADLIGEIDTASKAFRVLVLKTDGTTAYSSVLVTLDCGYWSNEAERELRGAFPNPPSGRIRSGDR